MNWISILGNISIWIILIPLLIGLFSYNLLNNESKIIFFVIIAGTIPQVLRPFFNNSAFLTVLYNLYTPIEFILYFILFRNKAKGNFFRKMILVTFFIFTIFSAFVMLKNGIEKRFLNEWVIINNIIQISWVCVCLMEYYKYDDLSIETYQPFFWFLSGITMYATCTTIFYGLWYFIKADSVGSKQLIKIIHHIFNILLYLFFSIGLLKNYLTKRN